MVFGTGLGIAFFMWRSAFTDDLHEKLFAAKTTVLADTCFTLPAVIIQPISGVALIWLAGWNPASSWLMLSYTLYIVAGLCWLPVVVIQIRLKRMVQLAVERNKPLPPEYLRLFRWWFALGWPAFIALIAVFYLMVVKPL